MAHIFISYIEQDILFAQHLKRRLQAEGFTVWVDETGDDFSEDRWLTIEASIYSSVAFLLVMSVHAQKSPRVRRELQAAHQFDKPIFPILFESQPWAQVADLEYFDMTTGTDSALPLRLVSRLAGIAPIRSSNSVLPLLCDEEVQQRVAPDTIPDGKCHSRNWKLTIGILGMVVTIGLFLLLIDFGGNSNGVGEELAPYTPSMQQSVRETLSGTEIQYAARTGTFSAHTEAALTAVSIATYGTATPTIDYRGTVDARFTATRMAADAQLAQAALVMSATASVQTVSATPMSTLTHTPTNTSTTSLAQIATLGRTSTAIMMPPSTDMPTPPLSATLPAIDTATVTAMTTPMLTQLAVRTDTVRPTLEAVVPNRWNVGTILFIQEVTGVSQYAGQAPDRPEQFQPGDEVTVGLGNVAPGQLREWYVVQVTQERWWFIDYLGGGWLPETVLADSPPGPINVITTESNDR